MLFWNNLKFTEKLQRLNRRFPRTPTQSLPSLAYHPVILSKLRNQHWYVTITYSPDFTWISVFFHYSNPGCYITLPVVSHISPVSSGLTGCHSFLAFDDLRGVLTGYPLECPSFWVCLVFLVIRLSRSFRADTTEVPFSQKLPEITIVVQFFSP